MAAEAALGWVVGGVMGVGVATEVGEMAGVGGMEEGGRAAVTWAAVGWDQAMGYVAAAVVVVALRRAHPAVARAAATAPVAMATVVVVETQTWRRSLAEHAWRWPKSG